MAYTADSPVAKRALSDPSSYAGNSISIGGVNYNKNSSGQFVADTGTTTPTTPTTPSLGNNPAGYSATPTSDQMLVGRDMNKEKAAATNMGLDANSIAGLKVSKLLESTYTQAELAKMPYYQYIKNTEAGNANFSNMQNTGQIQAPTSTMMRPLEEALKTKMSVGKEKLGESDVFKAAGLDPYINLAQSLQQHSTDMQQKYASYANVMQNVAGGLSDSYKGALQQYKDHVEQYNKELDRITTIIDRQAAYQQQLDLISKQSDSAKALKEWENSHPDLSTQQKILEGGYKLVNGKLTTPGSQEDLSNIFNLDQKSNYGFTEPGKLQCGEGYDAITTADSIGDSYGEKMNSVTKRTAPSVGNGLVIPLGKASDGKVANGHVETVIGIDGDNVTTVAWNLDLKGGRSFQTRSISDMQSKYGDNWGFTDSQLDPKYASQITGTSSMGTGDNKKYIDALNTVSSKMTPAKTTEAKKIVTDYLKNGDVESARVYLTNLAIDNRLTTKQKNDYVDFQTVSDEMGRIAKEANFDTGTGIYAKLANDSRKWLALDQDPDYRDLFMQVQQAQASYRRALFGTAVTDSEAESGKQFLIDPSDKAKDVLAKVKGMDSFSQRVVNRIEKNALGGIDLSGGSSAPEGKKYSFDVSSPIVKEIDAATTAAGVDITQDELQAMIDNGYSLEEILANYKKTSSGGLFNNAFNAAKK